MQSRDFVQALFDPEAHVPLFIKGQPQKRFAVYRNNVIVGLVNTLSANFPVVQKLLGRVYFAGLAAEFVRLHPPHSQIMFQYGELFPKFLARQSDLVQYPYLQDVAQAEILMRQAYHAVDAHVLDAILLSKVKPDDLVDLHFQPHPALAMMKSSFAIASIIRSNLFDEPFNSNFDEPENVVISRVNNVVQITALDNATFALITSLVEGKSLSLSTESAFELDEAFDFEAALSLILGNAIFSNIISSEQAI